MALYNEERAAMILSQSWMIKSFKQEIVDKSDLISYPKFKDAVNDPATFVVGGVNNGYVINQKSYKDPAKHEAMIALMDCVASDYMFDLMATKGGYFMFKNIKMDPKSVWPLYTQTQEYYVNHRPLTNFWILMPDPVTQEVYSYAVDELFAQTITAKQFVDKVQASIDKALKK